MICAYCGGGRSARPSAPCINCLLSVDEADEALALAETPEPRADRSPRRFTVGPALPIRAAPQADEPLVFPAMKRLQKVSGAHETTPGGISADERKDSTMSKPKTAAETLSAIEREIGTEDPAAFFRRNPQRYDEYQRASRYRHENRPGEERGAARPVVTTEQAVASYRREHKAASEQEALRAVFRANPGLYAEHAKKSRYRG